MESEEVALLVATAAERKDGKDEAFIILPKRGFVLLVSSLMCVSFLCSLDALIATALLATIGNEFSELNLVSWIGIAFMLGTATVNPVTGIAGNMFGRRRVAVIGCISFAIGCAGCGTAGSIFQLISFRFLQGEGAGIRPVG